MLRLLFAILAIDVSAVAFIVIQRRLTLLRLGLVVIGLATLNRLQIVVGFDDFVFDGRLGLQLAARRP